MIIDYGIVPYDMILMILGKISLSRVRMYRIIHMDVSMSIDDRIVPYDLIFMTLGKRVELECIELYI